MSLRKNQRKHDMLTQVLIDMPDDNHSGYNGWGVGSMLSDNMNANAKDPNLTNEATADSKKSRDEKKSVVTINLESEVKKTVEKKVEDVEDASRGDIERDIYQIVADGDVSEFTKFMKRNPNHLNMPNADGYYLVHTAILNNQLAIFRELLKLNADLNVVDLDGKTTLHHAITAESLEIVSTLINKGVPVTVVDNSGMMPIHTAAETGSLKIATLLIPTQPNINVKAEGGLTPLHLAAINNHGPIVRLLLSHKASVLIRDDHGNYPIHVAAKNASNSAIEALLEGAPKLGIDKLELLRVQDREKNMPIHCAVISGNIQGVGSTAVHLVAAQGLIEMAKVMYELQKELFTKAMNKTDYLKRTPLHWAIIFNHIDMISYLLEKPGIKANPVDVDGNTPLLIAASKGNIGAMTELLDAGADPYCKDRKRRNCLHLLVLSMEIVSGLTEILKEIKHYQKLVKGKDVYGFTALHYAAKCGNLAMFHELIKLGSSLNMKSNKRQTILHLAAQFGRYKTCVTVLSKTSGASLQNETDEQGMTPLHLAALCGQLKIVSLLLNKGVSISKDNKNNTPLHLAAIKGRVECMKTILTTHRNLLNLTNSDGNTALHLAATWGHASAVILLLSEGALFTRNNHNCCFYDDVITRRHQEVALAIIQHARWKEVFQYLSAIHGTFMIGLIKRLPDICLIVLDMCVTNSQHDPSSEDYYVEFNFKYLNLPDNFAPFAQYNKIHYVPLLPLEEMVRNNRVELLSHQLCVNFLRMKWKKYGLHLNFFGMGLYMAYLTALTLFIFNHDPFEHYDGPKDKLSWVSDSAYEISDWFQGNFTWSDIIGGLEEAKITSVSALDLVCLWFIICFSMINLIRGICILVIMKTDYLSFNLLLDLSVNVTALMFALPFIDNISIHFQWDCAAICIFLSWFNCLIYFQRFDLFGIYIVMFMEILKTLLRALIIFSLLNIAFGLAFYVLMSHEKNKAKENPWLSIYYTFIMFMELDYLSSYNDGFQDENRLTLHFPMVSLMLLLVFILLMPILLTNLLIGLAVGDIEAVQKEARLKRLATQVAFHSGAESKLPYLRTLTDERLKFYPNRWANLFMSAYSKLVGMDEIYSHEPSERDTVVTREMAKTNHKLDDIQIKLDKNIALMNLIMKRLHMNIDEELWDEGGIFVEGIGEIEETITKRTKDTKVKQYQVMEDTPLTEG